MNEPYRIAGMLHSNHNILEAKINGNVIYKQDEKYVEYILDGADEYIYEFESYIFPYIIGGNYYYAELYAYNKVYYYSPYNTPETSSVATKLANDIHKVRIYYPDNITSISFENTRWVRKITYIYTDDTITANIPYWLPVDNN